MKNRSPFVLKLVQNADNPVVEQALNRTQVHKRLNYGVHKRFNNFKFLLTGYFNIGSISAVSRVRSLILPEERLFRGDECGLIFPNSGW